MVCLFVLVSDEQRENKKEGRGGRRRRAHKRREAIMVGTTASHEELRARGEKLDAEDPLSSFRSKFNLPTGGGDDAISHAYAKGRARATRRRDGA